MDPTSVVVAGITGAATVTAAAIAARAGYQARALGAANAERLDTIARHTDPRQEALIKAAVAEVAAEHPELLTEALADEFVRSVLDAILHGHLERKAHLHELD